MRRAIQSACAAVVSSYSCQSDISTVTASEMPLFPSAQSRHSPGRVSAGNLEFRFQQVGVPAHDFSANRCDLRGGGRVGRK